MEMRVLLLVTLASCVLCLDAASLDLSDYLSASSNATCSNCSSPAQSFPAAFLDGSLTTWWETEEGAQPVLVSLSSVVDFTGFTLTIDISFRNSFPLSVGVYTANLDSLIGFFAVNCSSFATQWCQELMFVNDTQVQLTVNGSTGFELSLIFSGFQDSFTHYKVNEITVTGLIMPGYYLPDLLSVGVNEENGILNPPGNTSLGYDRNEFHTFIGRGYAISNYMINQSQFLQLTMLINHTTSFDNLFLRYLCPTNGRKHSTWIPVLISQGSLSCDVQFFINSSCLNGPCYARADPFDCAGQTLESGIVTIIAQLEGSHFFLDYIVAVPDAFNSTINECGFNNNSDYCVLSTLQQSLGLYGSLQECQCHTLDPTCSVLGGQCNCSERQVGRECNECIYTYYLNGTKCISCGCIDNAICQHNGQCPCKENVVGLRCDECIDDHYGDPSMGCNPCNCDAIGATGCNATTGECFCKPYVTGVACSECRVGFTNFSINGCQPCTCHVNGGNCSSDGTCICNDGYTGSDCDQCMDGSFQSSSGLCIACNCSGFTNSCVLSPGSISQEQCNCPTGYNGSSCEYCSFGYYRSNDSSCILCDCNNNSLICQDFSGECLLFPVPPPPSVYPPPLNCTPNTTGELCQYCADEYYNSSTTSELMCAPCPCHPSTTYNQSCVPVDHQPVCFCLPGHNGPLCDVCSSGYYGIPPDYPCSDCQCSGNIDANDPNACNHTTGECLNCLNNSTGPQCAVCADGFFGDASSQSCELCNCVASTSEVCDKGSGFCNCQTGVTGAKCTQCQDNFWNFSLSGCTQCMCQVNGSYSQQCDVTTGQCRCKPGVTGLLCDECEPEHYNFAESGCQACDCGAGAVNGSCHLTTGQCYCNNNVLGLKCDSCSDYYHQLTSSGCIECDNCVQSLKRRADSFISDLSRVNSFIVNAVNLQNTDTLDLLSLSIVIDTVDSIYNQSLRNLTEGINHYSDLTSNISLIKSNLSELTEQITELIVDVRVKRNYSESILISVINLHNSLGDMGGGGLNFTMDFVVDLSERVKQLLCDSAVTLANIQFSTNNLQETLANSSRSEAALQNITDIKDQVNKIYSDRESELSVIISFKGMVHEYDTTLMRLEVKIEQLLEAIENFTGNYTVEYYQLSLAASNISDSITRFIVLINESDATLTTVNDELARSNIIIKQLQSNLSDSLSSSGSSGIGQTLMSQSSIVDHINELGYSVNQLMEWLNRSASSYQSALLHADEVISHGKMVCRIINASLYAGNDAVAAIMDYSFVHDTVTLAEQYVKGLNLSNTVHELELLMSNELDSNVTEVFVAVMDLSSKVNSLEKRLSELTSLYILLVEKVDNAYDDFSIGLLQSLDVLSLRYQEVHSNTSITAYTIELLHSAALQNIESVTATYSNILSLYSSLRVNISETHHDLIGLSTSTRVIDDNVLLANAIAEDAHESFQERISYLNMINSSRTQLEYGISDASSSMIALRRQLIEAQEAAAMVDIALRFHGNGTATYNLSSSSSSGENHVSLYFRPQSLSGILLTDDSSGTRLQLENGQVTWRYGGQELQTHNLNLSVMEWYQVEASYDDPHLFLSVAPLQGAGQSTISLTVQANSNLHSSYSSVVLAGDAVGESLYTGCIDRVIVNGEMLPLLTHNIATVPTMSCGPRPATEVPRLLESGAWFQGQSQLSLGFIEFSGDVLTFSFAFRTFSISSQLVIIQNMNMTHTIMMYINESVVHMRMSLGIDVQTGSSSVVVNDGNWHYLLVSLNVSSLSAYLTVDEVTNVMSLGVFSSEITSPVTVTLGGTSWLNIPSFSGCIANFSVNDVNVDLSLSEITERVEVSNCPSSVSPGTRFMGTGSAVFNMTGWLDSVSFRFRTQQISSVLLHVTGLLPDKLVVSLFHTSLRVEITNSFNDIVMTSDQNNPNNLNDGQWHNVAISLVQNNILLTVDGTPIIEGITTNGTNYLLILGSLSVGGPAESSRLIVNEYFRGCIDQLRINSEEYDFNSAQLSDSVVLFGCHGDFPEPTASPPPIDPTGSGYGSGDGTISPSAVYMTDTASFTTTPTPTESLKISVTESVISTRSVTESSILTSAVATTPTDATTTADSSTVTITDITTTDSLMTASATTSPLTVTVSTPTMTVISDETRPPTTTTNVIESAIIGTSSIVTVTMNLTVTTSIPETTIVSPTMTIISDETHPPATTTDVIGSVTSSMATATESSMAATPITETLIESSTMSSTMTVIETRPPSITTESVVIGTPSMVTGSESSVAATSITETLTLTISSSEGITTPPTITGSPTISTHGLLISSTSTDSSSDAPSSTVSPTVSPTPRSDPIGLNGERGSFLSYNLPSDITYSYEITFTFRTDSRNALLLYIQSSVHRDYMALELRNGLIYYSYDLGAGSLFIKSSSSLNRYDDNMNHTVTITRNGTRGVLVVDGMEYSGSSHPIFSQLNTNSELIYLGGVSDVVLPLHLFSDQSLIPPGAEACFYYLSINGHLIDLRTPSAANGMTETCQDDFNNYISFLGSGYATLVNVYRPLVAYEFRLEFRTHNCSGLLLYSSSLFLEDHTALEISGGKIRFIFDNGHGPGIVEYIPANLSSLCDGNWHSVVATKSGVVGRLVVDGQPSVSTTLPSTGFMSVDTDSPLYAGGVPNNVLVRYTVTSGSFQGCLNNIQLVDSTRLTTTAIGPADIEAYSLVLLNTCQL